ncbi:MAG: DUF4178 domain-containing protein [Leptothrix sp. (in: b-proteobacteria)]
MATESPQRAYRAACPNCGGSVEFRSAASVSAICSYCRSTLVRDGEALRRIGQSAELFDDHSPLQLGASGRYLGEAFTLVGRLQLKYADGSWNEWHALFDNGKSGWLSEDNGAYVFGFEAALSAAPPAIPSLSAGASCQIAGQAWDIASVTAATLGAAEGELPHPPAQLAEFWIADLRNPRGEVGTLDGSDPLKPIWSVGRSVRLLDLKLQGLREASEKTLAGRSIECPSCGAALDLKLENTKSIACGQCKAVVDVSQGVGAELAHYAQQNGREPQLPLGSTGRLALGSPELLPWQVIGYLERCDLPDGSDDFEQTFWREYLLYHRSEGFVFLVDAEDGWSWVKPLTGAPKLNGERASWAGDSFKRRWSYLARTTYVLGEFYWRVRRDEQVQVMDFDGEGAARSKRLSREQQGQEVTWSAGEVLDAGTLADAFGILPSARAALRRDAAPLAGGGFKQGINWPLMIFLAIALLMVLMATTCSSDGCDETRNTFGASSAEYQQCLSRSRSGSGSGGGYGTSGGSWGGYSSGGGGHK